MTEISSSFSPSLFSRFSVTNYSESFTYFSKFYTLILSPFLVNTANIHKHNSAVLQDPLFSK